MPRGPRLRPMAYGNLRQHGVASRWLALSILLRHVAPWSSSRRISQSLWGWLSAEPGHSSHSRTYRADL